MWLFNKIDTVPKKVYDESLAEIKSLRMELDLVREDYLARSLKSQATIDYLTADQKINDEIISLLLPFVDMPKAKLRQIQNLVNKRKVENIFAPTRKPYKTNDN